MHSCIGIYGKGTNASEGGDLPLREEYDRRGLRETKRDEERRRETNQGRTDKLGSEELRGWEGVASNGEIEEDREKIKQ